MFERQQGVLNHAAPQRLCPSPADCINPKGRGKQSAAGSLSQEMAPITPRWRRCPFDVWARLRDVVSLCECAKPAPEKEKRKNQKICRQRKRNALKKE